MSQSFERVTGCEGIYKEANRILASFRGKQDMIKTRMMEERQIYECACKDWAAEAIKAKRTIVSGKKEKRLVTTATTTKA